VVTEVSSVPFAWWWSAVWLLAFVVAPPLRIILIALALPACVLRRPESPGGQCVKHRGTRLPCCSNCSDYYDGATASGRGIREPIEFSWSHLWSHPSTFVRVRPRSAAFDSMQQCRSRTFTVFGEMQTPENRKVSGSTSETVCNSCS
jgi:hypothetical protein